MGEHVKAAARAVQIVVDEIQDMVTGLKAVFESLAAEISPGASQAMVGVLEGREVGRDFGEQQGLSAQRKMAGWRNERRGWAGAGFVEQWDALALVGWRRKILIRLSI